MKTIHSLALFGAFLTVLAAPLWASSQPFGAEEFATLQMSGATAQDHQKLAAHFLAEAEAFEQAAQTHETMATRYNMPSKVGSVKVGMERHCLNLSRDLKEAAQEARQLAESHKAMVDQLTRATDSGAAPLLIPQRLADEELAALQMKGATAEDHMKSAAHFAAEAEALEQQAETHEAMAKRYNMTPKIGSLKVGMERHCLNLSRVLKDGAQEARQLAASHKAMADEIAK
jgi:hypothetical protein